MVGPASPFAPAMATWPADVAPILRRHYGVTPESPTDLVFVGRMDRVWRRHRWLGPLFWALVPGRIAFPENGADIPATMRITATRDGDGRAVQAWRRRFAFGRVRAFDGDLSLDESGAIVEALGPGRRLEVPWRITAAGDELTITTRGARLRLFGRRVAVPAALAPAVVARQRAIGPDAIRIELEIRAPGLGPVFGYEGTFQVVNADREPTTRFSGGPGVPGAGASASVRWLRAAAVYNLAWGIAAVVAPHRLARAFGFRPGGDGAGWRATGVMVLAYAPAYWFAAGHPAAARPILATAVFGKVLGAGGWALGALSGRLPVRTGVMAIANDLVWLPAFVGGLRRSGRRSATATGRTRVTDGPAATEARAA